MLEKQKMYKFGKQSLFTVSDWCSLEIQELRFCLLSLPNPLKTLFALPFQPQRGFSYDEYSTPYDAVMRFTTAPNHSFDLVDWEAVVEWILHDAERTECVKKWREKDANDEHYSAVWSLRQHHELYQSGLWVTTHPDY